MRVKIAVKVLALIDGGSPQVLTEQTGHFNARMAAIVGEGHSRELSTNSYRDLYHGVDEMHFVGIIFMRHMMKITNHQRSMKTIGESQPCLCDRVTLDVVASDPDLNTLTYSWTVVEAAWFQSNYLIRGYGRTTRDFCANRYVSIPGERQRRHRNRPRHG